MPFDRPQRKLFAEEANKMLLRFGMAWGAGDAGNEEGREEGAGVDIEVGGGAGRDGGEGGVG